MHEHHAPSLCADPVEASCQLLGSVLAGRGVAVRITEVEAYLGEDDPASHAYGGMTHRNRVMFGPAAHLYTYTMHGHTCANVVCSEEGAAGAVLIRAGEVVCGVDTAAQRRGGRPFSQLARGPGNLTKALGITMAHAGTPVLERDSDIRLELSPHPAAEVSQGPRVGVPRAVEAPLRFWLTGNPTVSAYRKAMPRKSRSH